MTREPPAAPRGERDERAAFRELYERTSPRIAAYLRRVTGSPEWSEDLLQDTYVRYLNAQRPEMDERQTVSYLFRIATNLVYDGWRSMRREREWEEASPAESTSPEPVGLRRDVEDALANYQRYREQRDALTLSVMANRERLRLTELRYVNGISSYFEVLDSQRQLFDAELSLSQATTATYASIVQFYRALGGGWQDPAASDRASAVAR